MASRTLPGIGLNGFWLLGESGWKTGADDNWRKLSALTQLSVKSRVATVPLTPADGDIHILTSDNTIAIRDNGTWVYLPASEGWTAWVQNENAHYTFDGAAWVSITPKNVSVAMFAGGTMGTDDVLFVNIAGSAYRLPSGAVGSVSTAQVAATASAVIGIYKISSGDTTSVGSITFAAAGTTATVTIASDADFAIGDMLMIKGPPSPDTTLADVSVLLKGVLL